MRIFLYTAWILHAGAFSPDFEHRLGNFPHGTIYATRCKPHTSGPRTRPCGKQESCQSSNTIAGECATIRPRWSTHGACVARTRAWRLARGLHRARSKRCAGVPRPRFHALARSPAAPRPRLTRAARAPARTHARAREGIASKTKGGGVILGLSQNAGAFLQNALCAQVHSCNLCSMRRLPVQWVLYCYGCSYIYITMLLTFRCTYAIVLMEVL